MMTILVFDLFNCLMCTFFFIRAGITNDDYFVFSVFDLFNCLMCTLTVKVLIYKNIML